MPIQSLSSNAAKFVTASMPRLVCIAMLACLAVACDRPATPGATDTTVLSTPDSLPDSVRSVITAVGWDSSAGPFIVLPTVDGGLTSGSLLRADASELTVSDTTGVGAAVADGLVDLFSRSGKVATARLLVDAAPRVDAGCTAWPIARLATDAGTSIAPWTAAFVANRVTAIPLDSIEGLGTRDSVRLAVDLTRLASALRDDTSATFRGLPFVVLRAYRARGLDTTFVVATLARRVNQEADPKEERLVMVVDVIGEDSRGWTVAWHERASGREEELVVAEPLFAFRANGSPDVRLLFGRDDGFALGAAVLSRGRTGWRVLWESAVAGCN